MARALRTPTGSPSESGSVGRYRGFSAAETPDGTTPVAATAEEPIRRFPNGGDSTVRPAVTELPLSRIGVSDETGAPGEEVRDFRAAGFVAAGGLVFELSAGYVHEPTGERVRVAFRYDRSGDAAVAPPAWYGEVAADGDCGASA